MTADARSLAKRISLRVADELSTRRDQAAGSLGNGAMTGADERALARKLIAAELESEAARRIRENESRLTPDVEEEVATEAHARLFGLGRLQRYLDDPRVTDVHIQGHETVWVKHIDGSRHRGDPVAESDAELVELLRTAAARIGRTERRFDAANPELNLHLPDGSRLFAVMEVAARPSVAIRKHQFDIAMLADLLLRGTLDEPLAAFLRAAVLARKSIVIGGGPGCGKTTMMRALINEIPPEERLVTIEDSLELGIDRFPDLHPNAVALEAREENIEGEGGITLEQLVRMGLRMDPDRVFVGEVRGSEVLPMLLAMSQGRDGSMCTIHAGEARGVFSRLAMFAMMPPHHLSLEHTALLVANAIDLVVHVDQRRDRFGQVLRYVTSVLEVRGADGSEVITNEVFRPGADGRAMTTGVIHQATLVELEQAGFDPAQLSPAGGVGSWT
jgi:pilus assembly protein CpaF